MSNLVAEISTSLECLVEIRDFLSFLTKMGRHKKTGYSRISLNDEKRDGGGPFELKIEKL